MTPTVAEVRPLPYAWRRGVAARLAAGRAAGRAATAPAWSPPVPPGGDDAGRCVLVVLLGQTPTALDATVTAVEALLAAQPVTAVYLTDSGDFVPLRRVGVRFDHVMSRRSWAVAGGGSSYEAYLSGRMAASARAWGAEAVVPLPRDAGSADPAVLASLLLNVGSAHG